MSFYLHASPKEGQDLEATGMLLGTSYDVKGWCSQSQDGSIAIRLVKHYSDKYDTEYLNGRILHDGSLVGTQGPQEDATEHPNQFILTLSPAEFMCYRPSPQEVEAHKARAMWKFVIQAIRYKVSKTMGSWEYFAARRDVREDYVKMEYRKAAYNRPLKPDEAEFERTLKQRLPTTDANFYHSIFEYRQRIVPEHVSVPSCRCLNTTKFLSQGMPL